MALLTTAQREQYNNLKEALLEIRHDASALMSVLSFQPDSGAWWIEAANRDLRMLFLRGRLDEAEALSAVIGTILQVYDGGSEDELAENQIHKEAITWLQEGIGAILAKDPQLGIKHLENLTGALYARDSLQWVAWIWLARGEIDQLHLEEARSATSEAMELALRIDDHAKSITLRNLGEISFLLKEEEKAETYLQQAIDIFIKLGDSRGCAQAYLTKAKIKFIANDIDKAIEAAQEARQRDPAWEEPVLFLVRYALMNNNPSRATALLYPLLQREPVLPEVQAEMRLVGMLQRGTVKPHVMAVYTRYRELPASNDSILELTKLIPQNPRFFRLRELIGWQLFKLGRDSDAKEHFDFLSKQKLDPELHNSVLLGIGCIASRKNRHLKSGARLRKASQAAVPVRSRRDSGDIAPEILASVLSERTAYQSTGNHEAISLDSVVNEFDSEETIGFEAWAELEEEQNTQLDSIEVEKYIKKSTHTNLDEHLPLFEAVSNPVKTVPSNSGNNTAKAAFTGDLQLLAVPDLLQFLKSSRRTGTLVITSDRGIGAINLKEGNIAGAASPNGKNLGEILKSKDLVSDDKLKEVTQSQSKDRVGLLLGSLLVKKKLVSEENIRQALTEQVQGAIIEMLDWKQGCFAFEPEESLTGDDSDIEIILDTQGVLLDTLREYDEANR